MTSDDFRRGTESIVNGVIGKIALGLLMSILSGVGYLQYTQQQQNSVLLGQHSTDLNALHNQVNGLSSAIETHNATMDLHERQTKTDLLAQQNSAKAELEKRQTEVLESIKDLVRSVIAQKADLAAIRQSLLDLKPSIVIPFAPE